MNSGRDHARVLTASPVADFVKGDYFHRSEYSARKFALFLTPNYAKKDTFFALPRTGESLLILTPVNPAGGKHRLAGVELSRYTRQHSNTTR